MFAICFYFFVLYVNSDTPRPWIQWQSIGNGIEWRIRCVKYVEWYKKYSWEMQFRSNNSCKVSFWVEVQYNGSVKHTGTISLNPGEIDSDHWVYFATSRGPLVPKIKDFTRWHVDNDLIASDAQQIQIDQQKTLELQQQEIERQERKRRQEVEEKQLWEKAQEERENRQQREAYEAEKERQRLLELKRQKSDASANRQADKEIWRMMCSKENPRDDQTAARWIFEDTDKELGNIWLEGKEDFWVNPGPGAKTVAERFHGSFKRIGNTIMITVVWDEGGWPIRPSSTDYFEGKFTSEYQMSGNARLEQWDGSGLQRLWIAERITPPPGAKAHYNKTSGTNHTPAYASTPSTTAMNNSSTASTGGQNRENTLKYLNKVVKIWFLWHAEESVGVITDIYTKEGSFYFKIKSLDGKEEKAFETDDLNDIKIVANSVSEYSH